MDVPRRGAIRNHRHRQRRGMGRVIQHLDVQYGGQAAEALRADAECIDAPINFQTQFFEFGCRAARDELIDIDGLHQRFLGQYHGLFGAAADAHPQHAGRAPTGAHVRNALQYPVGHRIRRIQHREHRLVLRSAALRRHGNLECVAECKLRVNHGGCVVARIGTSEGGVGHDGGAQFIVGIEVSAPHAFVDHRVEVTTHIPAHTHADLDEHHHDARVLTDGTVSFGTQSRVGENLCDGIARRRTLLHRVGAAHRLNEIRGVVVGNVLQGVGNARNDIFFANHGHVEPRATKDDLARKSTKSRAPAGSESLHYPQNNRRKACGWCGWL